MLKVSYKAEKFNNKEKALNGKHDLDCTLAQSSSSASLQPPN